MPRYLIFLSICFFVIAFVLVYRGYFLIRERDRIYPYKDFFAFICLALVGAIIGFLVTFWFYSIAGFFVWGFGIGGHYPDSLRHRILAVIGHLLWAFLTAIVSLLFTLIDSHRAQKL
jgi:hypothetical protein